MNNITVSMIKNMQHCIGFDRNKVTGNKYRIMHAFRNYYSDYIENENWNYLIELGLADRRLSKIHGGFVTFYLTPKGFNFLANLCGFKEIREIN